MSTHWPQGGASQGFSVKISNQVYIKQK